MTALDMTDSLAPNSDQLDAIDLITGPRNFTINDVTKGSPDQPFNFHLAEFDRPWRPGKSMRRVIVACWGPKTDNYIGKTIRLWCDPKVRFGPDEVGGVRILEMSDLDRPKSVPLLVSRGKTAPYKVGVLKIEAPAPAKADEATIARLTALFDKKGIDSSERPDLSTVTVDEARSIWRTFSAKPDAQTEPHVEEWPDVRQPGSGAA